MGRWSKTLLWFSVVVGPLDMHGRSVSSQDWPKLVSIWPKVSDLMIGTSSGATAAAQVRSGIPPAELLAPILSDPGSTGRTGPARAAVSADGRSLRAD